MKTFQRFLAEIDTAGFEPASYQRTMPKYVDRASITLVSYHKKEDYKNKKIIQSVQQG